MFPTPLKLPADVYIAQGDALKEMYLQWVYYFVFLRDSNSGNIVKLPHILSL